MFHFDNIPGHTAVKAMLLRNAQQGHVPHAQLFSASEGGVGLYLALAYATYINCTNPLPHQSCGQCASCVKYQKLVHPDLHFVFPTVRLEKTEAKSNHYLPAWRKFVLENPYGTLHQGLQAIDGTDKTPLIGVEEAREVIEKLSLKAFEATYKVMLIWQPERFNVQAANALLKILEEPPPQTVFLLVTHEIEKILPTILSRCQTLHLPDCSDAEIAQLLQQKYPEMTEQQVHSIAAAAEGNIQKALLLCQAPTDNYYEFFTQWMRYCYAPKYQELIGQMEEFTTWKKNEQKNFFQYALSLLRYTLLAQIGTGLVGRLPAAQQAFVQKFAKTLTLSQIESIMTAIQTAALHLEQNAHEKILFLDLSIEICKIFARGKVKV